MIELTTPRGLPVNVPETIEEDPSPRFTVSQASRAIDYYHEHGYVILSGVLAGEHCDRIRALWEQEVKPNPGFMYRQATAKAEKHVKNNQGWIMNPILNLQSVDPVQFPQFRDYATTKVLANQNLTGFFGELFGEQPLIVQSMYFEGNSATWEHQDSYYLDSEQVGTMSAAWIAIEDIEATAGRFFICPGSHKIRMTEHSTANSIADHHDDYILSVVQEIQQRQLDIRAPYLRKGDVLFWNSLTIHGSLNSQDLNHSRSSITCHVIPKSHKFLQLQTRIMALPSDDMGSVAVFRPKDLARLKNRLILSIEGNFPALFYWLKRQAIRYVVSRKANSTTAQA